jgi:preprotein translocase subunit SecG
MTTLLVILHVLVSLFLIAIVLLQHGKGADIGATFGGSSQSVFGSEGPLPLLNKITTFSAIIFMATSVSLAYISAHKSTDSVMKDVPAPVREVQEQAPIFMPLQEEQVLLPPVEEALLGDSAEVVQQTVIEEAAEGIQPEASSFTAQPEDLNSLVEETETTE